MSATSKWEYVPVPDVVPPVPALTVSPYSLYLKLATIVIAPSIVMVLVVLWWSSPTGLPVGLYQASKSYSGSAVAVTVTTSPCCFTPLPVVTPPPDAPLDRSYVSMLSA